MTEDELQGLIDKWVHRLPETEPYIYRPEVVELLNDFIMVTKAFLDYRKATYIESSGEFYERQHVALRLFFASPYDRLIMQETWDQLPDDIKQQFLFLEGCGLIWRTDLRYNVPNPTWAYMPTESGYKEYRQLQEKGK